jgi:hypothetical protein
LAQPADAVGVRAQGMAGAFTAIADDASATWWNPAGLAGGAFFNSIVEISGNREPSGEAVPEWRTGTRAIATAYPALGISYYRVRVSEIRPASSIAVPAADRQDQGSAEVRLRTLALNQFGATVGQSIGNHFVLASTVKLLRGSLASDVRPAGATLDDADALEGNGETKFGIDAGALARFGPATIGVMVRNVTESTFGTGDAALKLTRQVRVGFGLSSATRQSTGAGVTLAVDADVTTQPVATGDERRAAVGMEAFTAARVFAVRGGLSFSTLGERRPAASGGLSVAVKKGTFVDVGVTRGSDDSRDSWGLALRVTF